MVNDAGMQNFTAVRCVVCHGHFERNHVRHLSDNAAHREGTILLNPSDRLER